MTEGTIHPVISRAGKNYLYAHDSDGPMATVHSSPQDAERLAVCWNFCRNMSTEAMRLATQAQDETDGR